MFPATPSPGHAVAVFDVGGESYMCSDVYADDTYEFFHVHLPPHLAKHMPFNQLLTAAELATVCGVRVSEGWEHYMYNRPEPHIIPVRRRRPADSPYFPRYASMVTPTPKPPKALTDGSNLKAPSAKRTKHAKHVKNATHAARADALLPGGALAPPVAA